MVVRYKLCVFCSQVNAFLALTIIGAVLSIVQIAIGGLGAGLTNDAHNCNDYYNSLYCQEVTVIHALQ